MIERGDLWWTDLGEPRGAGPAFRRPMLVVSADAFNRSRIATVVCVTLTSNLRLADAPGNVLLERGTGGWPEASVANASQVVTLDKEDLVGRVVAARREPRWRPCGGSALGATCGLARPG